MGMEKNNIYYNEFYSSHVSGEGVDHRRWNLWNRVRELVPKDMPVIDLGCGSGELSQNRELNYYGFDFSEVAIARAKKKYPCSKFFLGNLFDFNWPADPRACYVFCEVLEHVTNDKILLGGVPIGAYVIISLPRKDSPAHVRFFPEMKTALERYRPFFHGTWEECDKAWWIGFGRRSA